MSRNEHEGETDHTYTVTLTLVTTRETDPQLHTPLGVENELRSWLEDLRAQVVAVEVNV